jgi:membrane fusion protein, multidrug efflux system
MALSNRRLVFSAALIALLGAVGFGTYIIRDGRAKEAGNASKASIVVPVSVAKAELRTLPVRLQAIGNVDAYTSVAIKARVDGQILEVNFKEGQQLRKNSVLFKIDPRPFETALRQAEATYARDVAARAQAQAQERRYQELLQKNFISKDAYSQYQTNAQTAGAVADASRAAVESARLNLEYCTIRSPIDGYAGKIQIQIGNLVKANDVNPLVVVNQVHPVLVTFSIPEQQLATIRKYSANTALSVQAAIPASKEPPAIGHLSFIDNAVDPTTGTIRLRGVFPNSDNALWPGQFVNVTVSLYEQADAIVIPSQAIQNGPNGEFVFVIQSDLTAEVRPVRIDRTDGDSTVIASGLKAGEQVVTRGQLKITAGAHVKLES